MPASAASSFDSFVATRSQPLWRLAWLLTGSEHRADELTELSLARVLPRWQAIEREGGSHEAAVRRELVAHQVAHGQPVAGLAAAEPAGAESAPDVLAEPANSALDRRRRAVLAMLATLPVRERAAVVLRHSSDVAEWDAADALEVSAEQLAALVTEATERARRSTPDGAELLAGLGQVVPEAGPDPGRAARARRRAVAARRRRRVSYAAVCAGLVALVAVPVAVSDPAPPEPASTPDQVPLPVAQRLVDALPIPDTCAPVGSVPEPPGYAYEALGADAVWLRFCPVAGADGSVDALDFAPDDTVVDREVDALVDGWAAPGDGPSACHPTAGIRDGLARVQVGTLDGSLHIVDMRVGCPRRVTVDGRSGAVDSRTAFVQAVGLLGTERLADVDEPGVVRPQAVFCPAAVDQVLDFERTTVSGYPTVRGLSMPLPAVSALVCRYPSAPREARGPGPRGVLLAGPAAETLRAAYLSRSGEHPDPGCGRQAAGEQPGEQYGVVFSDATGSHRTFTAALGACGRVRRPQGLQGQVGPWLAELLAASSG